MVEHRDDMNFIVESVCIDDVLNFDHIRYNTNNHWVDGCPPIDYEQVMSKTNTSNWIHSFKHYRHIEIDLCLPFTSWLIGQFFFLK